MIAVDTNVLVRLLTGDDPTQTAAAEVLFETGQVWIAKTVLLETEWVLRNGYKFRPEAVRDSFFSLMGFDHVHIEDEPTVKSALQLTEQGLDFADALHLSGRPAGVSFVSFDQAFVRRATRAGVPGVSIVPTV